MDLKKEILLGVGAVALYMAAREYGIHSLSDLRKKVGPYMKWVEVIEALTKTEEPRRSGKPALQKGGHHLDGSAHASKTHGSRQSNTGRSHA
jgi:hypothetical protein